MFKDVSYLYRAVWCVLEMSTGDRWGGTYPNKQDAISELIDQRLKPHAPEDLTLAHIKPNGTITYHEDY